MADLTHDDDALRQRLTSARTIAVVGASANPDRDAHRIFRFLLEKGYDVVPVNPTVDAVAGVPAAPDLAAARKRLGHIDIVDIFRRPDQVLPVVEDAVRMGAGSVWFQLGVAHDDAVAAAEAAGMDMVVDRCIKVEHGRLM